MKNTMFCEKKFDGGLIAQSINKSSARFADAILAAENVNYRIIRCCRSSSFGGV